MIPIIFGAQGASEVSDERTERNLNHIAVDGSVDSHVRARFGRGVGFDLGDRISGSSSRNDSLRGVLDAFPTTPLAPPSPVPDLPGPAGTIVVGTQDDEKRVGIDGAVDDGLLHDTFLAGYRHGGGAPVWEQRVLAMVHCESGWRLDPPGFHLGLAQFEVGTWEKAKCSPSADYRDPWEQGCAVARWMAEIQDYGSTEGWPNCWGS